MKVFDVPEGKRITVLENGAEVEYVPGKAYSDEAEGILTDKIEVTLSCPMSEDKPFPYRAAVYVDKNGVCKDKSAIAVVQGGVVNDAGMTDAMIRSQSPDFDAVIVSEGSYELKNVRIEMPTESDGKKICDFAGLGAAVAAFSGAEVHLENCDIETTGVGKTTLYADEGSDIVAVNCRLKAMGGKVYEGYSNNADFNHMVAPPWVLGIMGNARGTNLMGNKASTVLIDCDITARNWAVVSTDNGEDMHLVLADSTLTLVGDESERAVNPYFKKYGSGYGTYILGTSETFYGVTMNVGTYIAIDREGSAEYRSSKGTIRFVSPTTGKVLYEGEGKGQHCVLNSDAFGILAHFGPSTLTLREGTVMNTEDASFLVRAGGLDVNVIEGSELNSKAGILMQIIDDDDQTVGIDVESEIELDFHSDFYEKAGWPSENGQITSKMPEDELPEEVESEWLEGCGRDDVNFYAADVILKGDFYNGSGYYGQKAKELNITLAAGAVLLGTVSATETIHVNENGEQNTHFTEREYFYLGRVANRNFYNGDNNVSVRLGRGSVWNVTGEGILTSFVLEEGAQFNGNMTVDGVKLIPEAGKEYTGIIVVSAS